MSVYPIRRISMKKSLIVFLTFIGLAAASCRVEQDSLVIFHAGSLSVPFKHIVDAFSAKYPEISIQAEAAGSRTCARKITELNRKADILASADATVITTLLYPKYADFCVNFATNEMGIMYSAKSRFADKITSINWPDILLHPEVQYGHSDPNADPCGYRTLLCWKLAGLYFKRPSLYDELRKECPLKNIRPKETDLLALLESGELDYIFIYRSVAKEHHGFYLELPQEMNLGSQNMVSLYKKVSVEISGSSPGKKIIRHGAPIIYGITIPKNARFPKRAEMFLDFILSPKGQGILKKRSHLRIISPTVDHPEVLPFRLKARFKR